MNISDLCGRRARRQILKRAAFAQTPPPLVGTHVPGLSLNTAGLMNVEWRS